MTVSIAVTVDWLMTSDRRSPVPQEAPDGE